MNIVGYIPLAIVAVWLVIDIIFPLLPRALFALLRWYLQGVIDGK
jgi:hypothetical protein